MLTLPEALTQSQGTDTGLTSPSTDPVTLARQPPECQGKGDRYDASGGREV